MGGSAKVINPLSSGFLGGGTAGRIGAGLATGGLSEATRSNPYGLNVNNPLANVFGNGSGAQTNPYISGPFSLDPNQVAGDQSAINNLGQQQYQQTLSGIDTNTAAQTQRVSDIMKQTLPDIAENAQAAHLYDSTGYGQEVARQQAQLASGVASDASNQKLQALQGLQGFQTGALQRGQSLEDFINQANVSKSIGQSFAPQPPSGKSQFGTVASGIGALAPTVKAVAK